MLVSLEFMKSCGIFVGGSLESHFTTFIYGWLCSQRPSCPSLGLLFCAPGVGGTRARPVYSPVFSE